MGKRRSEIIYLSQLEDMQVLWPGDVLDGNALAIAGSRGYNFLVAGSIGMAYDSRDC
jgi:hypothetical protein